MDKTMHKSAYNHLASSNSTTLDADVGRCFLHLYMIRHGKDGKINASISMHLTIEEIERLIKELKQKLIRCYASGVEML